jgi:hypothetical protein
MVKSSRSADQEACGPPLTKCAPCVAGEGKEVKEQYIKERPREDSLQRWSLTSLETGGAIWASFVADDLLTAGLLTRHR